MEAESTACRTRHGGRGYSQSDKSGEENRPGWPSAILFNSMDSSQHLPLKNDLSAIMWKRFANKLQRGCLKVYLIKFI